MLCGVVSSLLSERLAMREEMAEIPLDRFVASKSKVGRAGGSDSQATDANVVQIEMV